MFDKKNMERIGKYKHRTHTKRANHTIIQKTHTHTQCNACI